MFLLHRGSNKKNDFISNLINDLNIYRPDSASSTLILLETISCFQNMYENNQNYKAIFFTNIDKFSSSYRNFPKPRVFLKNDNGLKKEIIKIKFDGTDNKFYDRRDCLCVCPIYNRPMSIYYIHLTIKLDKKNSNRSIKAEWRNIQHLLYIIDARYVSKIIKMFILSCPRRNKNQNMLIQKRNSHRKMLLNLHNNNINNFYNNEFEMMNNNFNELVTTFLYTLYNNLFAIMMIEKEEKEKTRKIIVIHTTTDIIITLLHLVIYSHLQDIAKQDFLSIHNVEYDTVYNTIFYNASQKNQKDIDMFKNKKKYRQCIQEISSAAQINTNKDIQKIFSRIKIFSHVKLKTLYFIAYRYGIGVSKYLEDIFRNETYRNLQIPFMEDEDIGIIIMDTKNQPSRFLNPNPSKLFTKDQNDKNLFYLNIPNVRTCIHHLSSFEYKTTFSITKNNIFDQILDSFSEYGQYIYESQYENQKDDFTFLNYIKNNINEAIWFNDIFNSQKIQLNTLNMKIHNEYFTSIPITSLQAHEHVSQHNGIISVSKAKNIRSWFDDQSHLNFLMNKLKDKKILKEYNDDMYTINRNKFFFNINDSNFSKNSFSLHAYLYFQSLSKFLHWYQNVYKAGNSDYIILCSDQISKISLKKKEYSYSNLSSDIYTDDKKTSSNIRNNNYDALIKEFNKNIHNSRHLFSIADVFNKEKNVLSIIAKSELHKNSYKFTLLINLEYLMFSQNIRNILYNNLSIVRNLKNIIIIDKDHKISKEDKISLQENDFKYFGERRETINKDNFNRFFIKYRPLRTNNIYTCALYMEDDIHNIHIWGWNFQNSRFKHFKMNISVTTTTIKKQLINIHNIVLIRIFVLDKNKKYYNKELISKIFGDVDDYKIENVYPNRSIVSLDDFCNVLTHNGFMGFKEKYAHNILNPSFFFLYNNEYIVKMIFALHYRQLLVKENNIKIQNHTGYLKDAIVIEKKRYYKIFDDTKISDLQDWIYIEKENHLFFLDDKP